MSGITSLVYPNPRTRNHGKNSAYETVATADVVAFFCLKNIALSNFRDPKQAIATQAQNQKPKRNGL